MDKNAIKKYAVWARRELISRVSQKALQYGITDKEIVPATATSVHGVVLSAEEIKQRKALIDQINSKGYEQVIEEVAYTWFNRFIALRFMEVNGYLPSRVRVFTDENNAFNPQILAEAISLEMTGLDMEKVYAFKDANDDDGLFKYLIITQCNALSPILPRMFQRISDYTELLFPDNLLREGSVIEQMISMIPEEDWKDTVQIVGWLYQYYNSEKKDEVFASLKKNVKITKENIPAATQLFTPDWIVRYMVENSLGRLWLEHKRAERESGTLSLVGAYVDAHQEGSILHISGVEFEPYKKNWQYFLEEAEQTPEVEAQLKELRKSYRNLKLEDIRMIDPCMGSGHILVYAFDVLMQIYEGEGWSSRDAVKSIIENNLYGLDIDDRAAQLAYFAVMMKARQYDRRFLTRKDEYDNPDVPQPHVYAIVESNGIDAYALDYFVNGDPKLKMAMDSIIKEMCDAKEYGSILNITPVDFDALYARFDEVREDISLSRETALDCIFPLVKVAKALAAKYDIVITNPPYMGAGNFSPQMMKYVKDNYFPGRTDLFAVFIKKCKMMARRFGLYSMITMQAWMFQSSFVDLREELSQNMLSSMVHLGAHAFDDLNGEVVQTVAFVFQNIQLDNYVAMCSDVTMGESSYAKEKDYLRAARMYEFNIEKTKTLPGKQYAYWISNAVKDVFSNSTPLSAVGIARRGLQTGNAPLFIRFWYELNRKKLTLPDEFTHKARVDWVLENNGGAVRKWYNSIMNAVLWKEDGQAIKNCPSSIIPSEELYFRRCITWNKLTTKGLALKLQVNGIIPGDLSPFFIANTEDDYYYCFALLNSCVAPYMMRALNPTITTPTGDVADFPVLKNYDRISRIKSLVDECVHISRADSATYEESWEYLSHPLIKVIPKGGTHFERGNIYLSECYQLWENECAERLNQLKNNEEEINRIFIDIYGLQDELTPDVDDKDVTLRLADKKRDIKSLISYAVGCMFGRYSLDADGLAFAGGEWDDSRYSTFEADKDSIIPICDDEYYTDDIVGRFVRFVEVVYGKQSLDENLRFIADALGGSGQPKDVIRKYFMDEFYADHLKIYQKRPIYWLFDSGKKGGFRALVYMHRYQPDTIARMRTDYVHEQQARYRTAIADLEQRMASASTSERVKLSKRLKKLQEQAAEIQAYEEKIHHLADQYIAIELDDGVKVNYAKFQDVLAKIK